MTKERIAHIRQWFPRPTANISDGLVHECLDEIERLSAEKSRLIAEVYRLNETIAKAKAAFLNPGEAYTDEKTAIAMWEVLEGKA